jgi:hypothetical protein
MRKKNRNTALSIANPAVTTHFGQRALIKPGGASEASGTVRQHLGGFALRLVDWGAACFADSTLPTRPPYSL